MAVVQLQFDIDYNKNVKLEAENERFRATEKRVKCHFSVLDNLKKRMTILEEFASSAEDFLVQRDGSIQPFIEFCKKKDRTTLDILDSQSYFQEKAIQEVTERIRNHEKMFMYLSEYVI